MRLRIATFNLENLGRETGPPGAEAAHLEKLRPQLLALDADILCLQEIDAQKPDKRAPRRLAALEALIRDTPYAGFTLTASEAETGLPADIHNLVILSRFPVLAHGQYRQDLMAAPLYRATTSLPPEAAPQPVAWDRPILHAVLAVGARRLHVLNLHLRAPLAAPIQGRKAGGVVWRDTAAWAEGFFLATVKRTGQALEARLLVDRIFDAEAAPLIAVTGDFNCEGHETPVRVLLAAAEDTGDESLEERELRAVLSQLPPEELFSLRYHGKRYLVDHLLVSPALAACFRGASIANRGLDDEYEARGAGRTPAGSFHAPVAADFEIPGGRIPEQIP